jgi:integrase
MAESTAPTPGQIINALPPGKPKRLVKIDRGGSLEARRLNEKKVLFYWRYTQNGVTDRIPIGPYDPMASPKKLEPTAHGYSVKAAIEAAAELAKRNRETPGGIRGEEERKRLAEEQEAQAAAALKKYTLENLCSEYCDWLKKQNKISHQDTRSILKRHVFTAYPDLAATPAALVQRAEIMKVLRKMAGEGKIATARKVRAGLRAAYACALKFDENPNLPEAFQHFGVTSNPVESISAFKTRSAKNPLTLADMRKYWNVLKAEEGVRGACLRVHVLTGGQRVAQLLRAKVSDVDETVLRLWDGKGRRDEPRLHLVPLTKHIQADLTQLSKSGYLFSADGGKTHINVTTLGTWAAEVAKKAEIDGFQLKRIRSGVETALATANVDLHIRGQLQSHGLGGVQAKHYDAYEYLSQKRAVIEKLRRLLEQQPASVTSIKEAKRA